MSQNKTPISNEDRKWAVAVSKNHTVLNTEDERRRKEIMARVKAEDQILCKSIDDGKLFDMFMKK